MKRLVTLLVILGLLMAFPAGAAAEKPPAPPGPPGGDNGPMAGTECVDTANPDLAYQVSDDFVLTAGGEIEYVCIDVSDVIAGDWDVTVDVTGSLRELLVVVRDSVAPGDACAVAHYRRNTLPDSPFPFTLPFTLPVNAADRVNSCGIGWAEMVGDDYYATAEPDIPSPLAFMMFIKGGDSTTKLDVRVDYPNAP